MDSILMMTLAMSDSKWYYMKYKQECAMYEGYLINHQNYQKSLKIYIGIERETKKKIKGTQDLSKHILV
jgi:hypothetical protein